MSRYPKAVWDLEAIRNQLESYGEKLNETAPVAADKHGLVHVSEVHKKLCAAQESLLELSLELRKPYK